MKFKGLPFRSNIIFRSKKLIIINNSKATNITSTINSLESKKNVYLIMGGIAKEINFKILHKFNNKIKKLYLYGYSSSLIYNQVNKLINSKTFINLKNVVDEIHKDVKNLNEQPTILFAPACTSYDQYNSFEERGMHFNQLIKERFKI